MNYDKLRNGSKIHIKKSHDGKFTEYCGGKVTSECIARGKKSPSAKVRKMAVFADNARTFKHQTGGKVYFNILNNSDNYPINITYPYNNDHWPIQQEKAAAQKTQTDESTDWAAELLSQLNTQTQASSIPVSKNEEVKVDTSKSKYSDWKQFRDELFAGLQKQGYDGETAKALVAQMGLETGHGKHMAGNFNYGNITAGSNWTGKTAVRTDNQNGRSYTFRSYDSLDESLKDYLRLASIYDIKPGDTKEDVYAKLNGQNSGGRKWAEAANYAPAIDKVYKMYWG